MSTRRQREWREADAARRAVCVHHFSQSRWAGILGWRYDCHRCGSMFVPDEHHDGDGCEYHPKID